jgi:CBS domain-containing protein
MHAFAALATCPVAALAGPGIAWVAPDADLASLCRALAGADVGALVVGDPSAGAAAGVVSERDVVRALASGRDPSATTAGDLASREVVSCSPSATVMEATARMLERSVRHLLIEVDGRFVGIVSARDLLSAYASAALSGDLDDPDDPDADADLDLDLG